ncbi:MAG TPA: SDR family oxidoreductase [Chloroflexota bacterium]|jgi:NADH dehydrogenase|nr:SDR family oxidoreductase [Chloroflexota bacterium]
MKLVVGATGQLGGLIAHQLLQHDADVRVLVRPSSTYQPLVDAGARPVFGDLKDRASLDAAVQGVDVVITTANAVAATVPDTIESVDLLGNRDLIDAARAAGVGQFIFTSALGSTPVSPVPFMRAKALTEEHLRTSGMPFTILAPNFFMDVWIRAIVGLAVAEGRPVTLVGEGCRKHSMVAISDVAAFAVASVGHPAATNRYLAIGGPQALSWHDVVTIYEELLGRAVAIQTLAPGEVVPGLPPIASGLMAAMDTYDSPLDMAETASIFGVELTSVETFARRTLAGVERSL